MRSNQFLTACVAALMFVAPTQAFAQDDGRNVGVQDRARPEYDPLGLRFGGFDLNASLEAGVSSTDNVLANDANKQDDIYFTVTPNATLASHWSRHAFVVSGGGQFTSHQDFDSEDAESAYVSAFGRLDVGPESSISANVRASQETEPRTSLDAADGTELVEYSRLEAGVSGQYTINRVRLIGSFSTEDVDFEDTTGGTLNQNERDRSETAATGRVEVAVTPDLAIIGQYTADQREYDSALVSGLDSEGQTILAGVRMNLSNLVRGEFTAGQVTRDYDLGESVESLALAGNVQWFITELTTISFNASREVEETGGTIIAPYVSTRYGGRVDHELLRNMIISGGVTFATREYEDPIDREDEGMFADIEAKYLMNRRISLRAAYVYEESESSGLNAYPRDFEVNTFFIGAAIRL